MSSISDKTKFTLTVVLALIGASTWMTTLYMNAQANSIEIAEVKAKVEQLEGLATDVAVIKSEVHEIHKKVDSIAP